MALKDDGTVVAWGNNKDGLIDGYKNLNNVIAISARTRFGVVLTDNTHGIIIDANNAITISGNITINGTGKKSSGNGVQIISSITSTGNVTINGTMSGFIGVIKNNKCGILLNANITTTGNFTLNGTSNIGILINKDVTISGNVTLNGTVPIRQYDEVNHFPNIGIYINTTINTILGNIILNGTAMNERNDYGVIISVGGSIINTATGNLTLYGTATTGIGIDIANQLTNTSTGNLTLYGTATTGIGICIEGQIKCINSALYGTATTGIAVAFKSEELGDSVIYVFRNLCISNFKNNKRYTCNYSSY